MFKLTSLISIEVLFEISAINSMWLFEPLILLTDKSPTLNISALKSEACNISSILTSLLKTTESLLLKVSI